MTIHNSSSRISRRKLANDISTNSSLECVSDRLRSLRAEKKTELKPRFFREPNQNFIANYQNRRPPDVRGCSCVFLLLLYVASRYFCVE